MAMMMQQQPQQKKKNPESSLPPGFRFHPTDEELILHYLQKKVASIPFPVSIIADVDIYKFDPWDLPGKATFGEKEWYFFSPRDRKYPNGARPNRAAASGYWKATGTDKIISLPSSVMSNRVGGQVNNCTNIGVKKALVFYKGRPPKGVKTNWIMHEYRLADAPSYSVKPIVKPINKDSSMRLDDWVLCRIYKKPQSNLSHQSATTTTTTGVLSSSDHDQEEEEEDEEQFVQQTLLPLSSSKSTATATTSAPLMPQKSSSFSNLLDATDYSLLSSFLSDPQFTFNVPPPANPNDDSSFALMVNQQQQQQQQQQPCFGSMSTNGGYLHHKLPQLQHSTPLNGEMMLNRPKRERSDVGDDDHVLMTTNPLKRSINSSRSNFTNNNISNGGNGNNWGQTTSFRDNLAPAAHHNDQYGFLNQQLLLSHHLQFQG